MRLWAILTCAALLAGCANRGTARFEQIARQASSREFLAAAERLRKDRASLYGRQSDLLYHLDMGALFHYAGAWDSSIVHLARAADIHEDLYTRSVTNEAASLLVNDNLRPYRGRPYEIVWLHVFQAFNYLATGRVDGARVEMRRASIYVDGQRRAAGANGQALRDDPLFRAVASLVYEAAGDRDDAAISAYHAVKAHRDAKRPVPPALAAHAWRLLDEAGRPEDIRTLGLQPPPDAAAIPGGGEIVVIAGLGRSPALGETVFQGTWVRDGMLIYHYHDADGNRITDALPAPGLPREERGKQGETLSGTTFGIKWAMPSLREVPSQAQSLRVAGDFGIRDCETWGDTRFLLERDLQENQPALLTRTVVRVVLRTAAAQKAKAEIRTGDPVVNLLTNLGVDFLSGQLEQADVRMWFLLPRTVNVTRIPVAAGTHTVQLGALSGAGRTVHAETRRVEVQPGRPTFVFFSAPK